MMKLYLVTFVISVTLYTIMQIKYKLANTILLSRVLHILRVVLVPSKWLKDIKSIVSQFVLPFWVRPSFSILCLPRNHGGLGLTDTEQQHVALRMIYIQRLLADPSDLDIVSSWLAKYYQIYIGHTSLLPWFLYPQVFKAIELHAGTWILPLQIVTVNSEPLQLTIPLRYLLSDTFYWSANILGITIKGLPQSWHKDAIYDQPSSPMQSPLPRIPRNLSFLVVVGTCYFRNIVIRSNIEKNDLLQ
ncbi:hypothetical protein BDF21DRAFT_395005 [Thamnidium elegans]|nr:hypothetical protein BDF21DRAFT_395005 [Thamnidium elegans]